MIVPILITSVVLYLLVAFAIITSTAENLSIVDKFAPVYVGRGILWGFFAIRWLYRGHRDAFKELFND